jgi:hypothetical protein
VAQLATAANSEIKQPIGDSGSGPTTTGVCGSMLGTDRVGVKQCPKVNLVVTKEDKSIFNRLKFLQRKV